MYMVGNEERANIIVELVKSLNMGACGFNENRPQWAILQYKELVKAGVIVEKKDIDKLK